MAVSFQHACDPGARAGDAGPLATGGLRGGGPASEPPQAEGPVSSAVRHGAAPRGTFRNLRMTTCYAISLMQAPFPRRGLGHAVARRRLGKAMAWPQTPAR